jgi:hypothetical protein
MPSRRSITAVVFGLIDLAIFNAPALIPGVVVPLVLFVLVGLPAAALGASMTTILQTVVAEPACSPPTCSACKSHGRPARSELPV